MKIKQRIFRAMLLATLLSALGFFSCGNFILGLGEEEFTTSSGSDFLEEPSVVEEPLVAEEPVVLDAPETNVIENIVIDLVNDSNVFDDSDLALGGTWGVATATVAGNTYLFATGVSEGFSGFLVQADGTLVNTTNVTDSGNLNVDGGLGVDTAEVGGTTYLFVTGYNDDGISVFEVRGDGSLVNVANVNDDGNVALRDVWSITSAVVGGVTYLFTTSVSDNGVSVFRIENDGNLVNVANVFDNATLKLAGAAKATTAVVEGVTYLFVTSYDDDGVSVFEVRSDGSLVNVHNLSDDEDLKLDGANGMATTTIGGTTYLFAAGNYDHGLSVFSVGSDGSLLNLYNLADNADLRLDGAWGITTARVEGNTYVLVSGRDEDGVSGFCVADSGKLVNVANVTYDNTNLGLYATRGIVTAEVGGANYFFVAAQGGRTGVGSFEINVISQNVPCRG